MAKIPPFNIDSLTAVKNVPAFARQVKKSFIDLGQILLNLSPTDNFNGFMFEGVIGATTETKITNRLLKVPTGYLIIFCQGGSVQAGNTDWSKDFVYLQNDGATSIVVKVFFFM